MRAEKFTLNHTKYKNINKMNATLFIQDDESWLLNSSPACSVASLARKVCFVANECHNRANLLDMMNTVRVGRFAHHIVDESAVGE